MPTDTCGVCGRRACSPDDQKPTWPTTDAERIDYVDWQYEVANGDTVLDFRDWVDHRDEAEAEAAP